MGDDTKALRKKKIGGQVASLGIVTTGSNA